MFTFFQIYPFLLIGGIILAFTMSALCITPKEASFEDKVWGSFYLIIGLVMIVLLSEFQYFI